MKHNFVGLDEIIFAGLRSSRKILKTPRNVNFGCTETEFQIVISKIERLVRVYTGGLTDGHG